MDRTDGKQPRNDMSIGMSLVTRELLDDQEARPVRHFIDCWPGRDVTNMQEAQQQGTLTDYLADDQFRRLGIQAGDLVYVVSVWKKSLHLLSKIEAGRVCGPDEAAESLGYDLQEMVPASTYVIAARSTPFDFEMTLPTDAAAVLELLGEPPPRKSGFSPAGPLGVKFPPGVREIAAASAALLDSLLPAMEEVDLDPERELEFTLPDEVLDDEYLYDDDVREVTVNAHERNLEARQLCIAHHGCHCNVCGFDFGETYGPAGANYIHVHFLRPLVELGEDYEVDPVNDLRPVCPNCHAMIHSVIPPYSLEELKAMLKKQP
jgi:hypothetical protein